MFSLQFLLSVGSFKSAIDTLISFAVFPPRNLKFRLTAQASFHLVECVVLLQRNDLMFFRVEWRGGILKGGSEGLLTGQQSLRIILSQLLSANYQL